MATRLMDKVFVKGGYLDSNVSVTSISELIDKYDFDGQSVHMPEAFLSTDEVPYPVDFWYVPNGDDIKWEIKTIPSIASLEDFENFKDFIDDFESQAGYYPIANGTKVLVDGEEFEFHIDETGKLNWLSTQEHFDETISDAVKLAVDEITSGASEAFDTLKEVEDWIKTNGEIVGKPGADGKSAYELWLEAGNEGTVEDFLVSLKGAQGEQGIQGEKGEQGEQGIQGEKGEQGEKGADGKDGADGKSAYELWLEAGNEGSEEDFLASLKGEKGALDEEQVANVIYSAKSYTDQKIAAIEVPAYTTGEGVSIKDNKIAVLIETGDTENKNYIKVNEDNSLSVEEIGLDDTVTTEEIQVNGGAWADAIKDIYGDSIPVGTSFQDFLKAMSCKEYFVTTVSVSSAFTVTCGDLKPGISGAESGDMVEVGSEIILNEVTGTNTTARQRITIEGLEYGYKLGANGTYISSKKYEELPLPISATSGVQSIRVTFSKFSDRISGGNVLETKTGEKTVGQTTMYAQEGSNKVTIYQTGDTYTSNVNLTGGTIFIATNLKNYYKADKSTPNIYTPEFAEITKTATASTSYTVTGAHKYFIGDITEYAADYWDTDRSEVVRGLEMSDWATASTITKTYTFKTGTKQQTVVVPSTYTSVAGKDVNNGDVEFNHVKTFDFTNSKGFKTQYKVFVAPALDGLGVDSLINITIKK